MEESDARFPSVMKYLSLGESCSSAARSRKVKIAKVCVKSTKREGINCPGDSCDGNRGTSADSRSVWQSLPETSPEVKLRCLVCQITLPEQNNLTFSFDICVRLVWSANGMSQFGSTSEKHTGCSVFRGWILHLSCQSSKEYLAWHWWMRSHEAERCLTSLV